MADVTYGYTPTNGVAFNVGGWNSDIRSTTNGVSIYGELNGNIEDANFAAGVEFVAAQYKPNEVHLSVDGGELTVRDFHDDLFGSQTSNANWAIVPGAAHRVYIPWNADAVMFNVSAFMTNWRQRETTDSTPASLVAGGPEMYVRMAVDDDPKAHTKRPFPYTAYPDTNPGTAVGYSYRVQSLTQHIDLCHLETSVTKGWHSVRLEVLIPRTHGLEHIVPIYKASPKHADHFVRHHIRFGIRRAGIIAF